MGVPWQPTYRDQMECWGFVVLQLEQVCVRVREYNFDTHRCLISILYTPIFSQVCLYISEREVIKQERVGQCARTASCFVQSNSIT